MKKARNKYPKGWDAAKVRRVLDHYDRQTDEEAAEEIASAPIARRVAWVEVPTELLPQVRRLLARHQKSA